MKCFDGKTQWFLMFLTIGLLSACGGGGGSSRDDTGGGSQTSSSSGNTVTESTYSISVDKSAISVDLPFKSGPTAPVTIQVTYAGDGLIAGFPPEEAVNTHLGVGLISTSSTTANLTINVNSTFIEAKTYIQHVRLVTGKEDGSKYVIKDIEVTIKQLDGFAITAYASGITGLWGDTPRTADFLIETIGKKWTVSSPTAGITFSTDKGESKKQITVSYDYLKTPVNTESVDIVFAADTGETITKTLNFSLYAPDFSRPIQDVNLPNQRFGQALAPIALDLSTGKTPLGWTATLPAWLSATKLAGVTGQDNLQLYVDPSKFPDKDTLLTGNIHIQADLLGGKIERDIKTSFSYQQARMQPSQAAFAFSDYATNEAHNGEFWINTPTDASTQVVSNSSWLKVDSVVDSKVKFHLNTSSLPAGFQTAEISLSQPNSKAFVATKVHVGYYKSNSPITYGAATNWGSNAYAVKDKLGPWLYVGRSDKEVGNTLIKYNYITRSVEKTLEIKELRGVGSLVVSDDGQYLFGLSYDYERYFGRIIIIDLKDFSRYTIVPAQVNGAEVMQFVNIDGKLMVSAEGILFDAFTGEIVPHSYSGGYWLTLPSSPSGEYSIFGNTDSLGYIHYDYNHLTDELSGGNYVSQVNLAGDKIMRQSNNGDYLGVLKRDWSVTGSRILSVYKIGKGALNTPSFTQLHTGKTVDEDNEASPSGVVVGDDGRYALYSTSFGLANRLDIYRSDQSLVASYANEDILHSKDGLVQQKGRSWFYSSDNKALIYFQGPFGYDQTLYIYPAD